MDKKRIEKAEYYNKKLNEIEEIICPKRVGNVKYVYHLYTLKVKKRDSLKQYLAERGIQTSINYPVCLPLLPAYKRLNHKKEHFKNSYRFS